MLLYYVKYSLNVESSFPVMQGFKLIQLLANLATMSYVQLIRKRIGSAPILFSLVLVTGLTLVIGACSSSHRGFLSPCLVVGGGGGTLA